MQLQGALANIYAQQDVAVLALQVTKADVILRQVKEELVPPFWHRCFCRWRAFIVNIALEGNSLDSIPTPTLVHVIVVGA